MIPPRHHPHGIITLDADHLRPGLAAIHLLIEAGRVAIIDTGTHTAVASVLAELKGLGLSPDAVDYIITTHVHLDHAGGAGALLQSCRQARLVVHPSGARHLIDPARLVASSIEVYGQEHFLRLYGEIMPAPEARVLRMEDGARLEFHGRSLTFLDTPGHARHHFCVHDARSAGVFTGDAFGVSYREFDVDGRAFIFPTTTPTQFDPQAMHASIDRILALRPAALYLTHYGRVTPTQALAAQLHDQIDAWCELTRGLGAPDVAAHAALEAALHQDLRTRLRQHGCTLSEASCRELLAHDVALNAHGLLGWRARQEGPS